LPRIVAQRLIAAIPELGMLEWVPLSRFRPV
jgi:hypothetical protein